ncbi:MAG: TIM barrel protein [Spirochaetaceae bacterium]
MLRHGTRNISENEDIANAFARNAKRMIHIHWNDNFGIEDEHLEPTEGNIDFPPFFKTAKEVSYKGMVELEVSPRDGEDPLIFYKRNYKRFVEFTR